MRYMLRDTSVYAICNMHVWHIPFHVNQWFCVSVALTCLLPFCWQNSSKTMVLFRYFGVNWRIYRIHCPYLSFFVSNMSSSSVEDIPEQCRVSSYWVLWVLLFILCFVALSGHVTLVSCHKYMHRNFSVIVPQLCV